MRNYLKFLIFVILFGLVIVTPAFAGNVIPEPSTFLLLGAGFAAVGLLRGRLKKLIGAISVRKRFKKLIGTTPAKSSTHKYL